MHLATRHDPGTMADIKLTALRLAGLAGCDPRSALAWLRGRPIRGLAGERIERAARELGVRPADAVPPESPPEGATP
jgi:hypothetical protein